MADRNKGILVSVLGSILYMILSVALGAIVSVTNPDPWSGLVLAIFMILGGVVVLLVIMIVAAIKYRKTQSQYALGVTYGIGGYLLAVSVTFLINALL